jgi:ferritin-like protein
MKLNHPELIDLLQKAYSAERAASFAYQGHAGSVKSREEKEAIKQIGKSWNLCRNMGFLFPDIMSSGFI